MKDDNQDLARLLHNDAKSVRELEAFDSRLHQDTMREISLGEAGVNRERWFTWSPLNVSVTAAMAVMACVWVLRPGQPPAQPGAHPGPEIALVVDPAPGSSLAYRQALAEGEDALLAMLDRDGRSILPRSVDAFQSDH